MRTLEELQRMWDASPGSMRGDVRLICVRVSDGVHECPPRVRVTADGAVEGDRWATGVRHPEAQVTLMSARVAELVAGDHAPLHAAGDNFLVDLDLSETSLPTGTRLRLGTTVLEVTAKPHTGCKKFAARFGADAMRWINDKETRALRLRGINCRVIHDGEVSLGDIVTLLA